MINKNISVKFSPTAPVAVVELTGAIDDSMGQDVSPLLKAIKFWWNNDTRRFKMFASIAFPTWEEMINVMLGLFGNKENDKYSIDHLTVAYRMSKWTKGMLFSLFPAERMTERMDAFLSSDTAKHHVLEWTMKIFADKDRNVSQALVLERLLGHMSELRWEIKKMIHERDNSSGKEKAALLKKLRKFFPRVEKATAELELNLEKIKLYPQINVWRAPEQSAHWPESITALDLLRVEEYTDFQISHTSVMIDFPHLAEHDPRGFRVAAEKKEEHVYEIDSDYVWGLVVFVAYCKYYFGMTKKTKKEVAGMGDKVDDAKFLERWCGFVDGGLQKVFLKKYEAVYHSFDEGWTYDPNAPELSRLISKRIYQFDFDYLTSIVENHFSSAGDIVELMNYCIIASRAHMNASKTLNKAERAEIDMASHSCPLELKNARLDLRFSNTKNYYCNYYSGDYRAYMKACYEANVFTGFKEKVYFHNLLHMMKSAHKVKQDALKKKQALLEDVPEEVQKKQKKRASSNQVTITARPQGGVRVKVDLGNGQVIDMPGFKLIFCPTYKEDDPTHGHVEVWRKYENKEKTDGKWTSELAGIIKSDGLFLHTKALFRCQEAEPWVQGYGDLFTLLKVLDSNPVECSSILARMTGSCLACGLPMTQEESLKSGFGAKCMKNLGLKRYDDDEDRVYQFSKDNKVVGNLPMGGEDEHESPMKKHKHE